MSVTLVGGGRDAEPRVWRRFVVDAAARSPSGTPRVAVVAVRSDAAEHAAWLVDSLSTVGPVDPVVVAVGEGEDVAPAAFDAADGVLVGGGTTPAVLDALEPHRELLRALVDAGVPYCGFSAGAAIAADLAVVGGWRSASGHPVCDEEVGEGLEQLTVREGLGLAPCSVDVHAAQWGTLARLLAAVDGGLVPEGVAIDERTAVVLDPGAAPRVVGAGSAWWAAPEHGRGMLVRRQPGT